MSEKARALLIVAGAYSACVVVGFAVLSLTSLPGPWNAAVADIAATLIIFGFSRYFRNSSFYDAYWSVIPPLLVLHCVFRAVPVHDSAACRPSE